MNGIDPAHVVGEDGPHIADTERLIGRYGQIIRDHEESVYGRRIRLIHTVHHHGVDVVGAIGVELYRERRRIPVHGRRGRDRGSAVDKEGVNRRDRHGGCRVPHDHNTRTAVFASGRALT